MKKISFVILLFCGLAAGAQTIPNIKSIKLEQAADFRAAQPFVLQAANYLLLTPYDAANKDRKDAIMFLVSWLRGTPDFSFSIESAVAKIGKGDDDAISMYVVAACKTAIDDKSVAGNRELLKLNAIKTLLAYAENPSNNFKMKKQLKKLSDANKNGELAKALE